MILWPFIVIAAAALQVVRNAAQRNLTETLGVWGASYVRFFYGFPFALMWLGGILAWRGFSGASSLEFWAWIALGAAAQSAATAALVLSMKGRGFAVAVTLQKTEVLGSALIGVLFIQDHLSLGDWLGAGLGTLGVTLMARVSADRAALRAAMAGIGAGLLFAVSAVAYRGATQAWGGDPWMAAAAGLVATVGMQTLGGAILIILFAPKVLKDVVAAWRPSLTPGAAGALSSALLFTGFALGPSAAAVKTVQLIDVLMAWVVSRRMFKERTSPIEIIGASLVVAGAASVFIA